MADIYLRSTDGSDADDGSTWALAKATLAGAASIDAAGDKIYVSQSHAESTASALSFGFAGTPPNPVHIICGNDAAAPPTTPTTTATVTTTGTAGQNFAGSFYCYGVTFNIGTGSGNSAVNLCNTAGTSETQHFENCKFRLLGTGTGMHLNVGSQTGTTTKLVNFRNVDVRFSNGSQAIRLTGVERFIWSGGVVEAGSTPVAFISSSAVTRGGRAEVSGVDFSLLSSSFVLFAGGGLYATLCVARNCKLPSGVTSPDWIASAVNNPGARFEGYNCSAGDQNFRIAIADYAGRIRDETTIVRTGGASDGTTAFSHCFATSANANQVAALIGPEAHIVNAAVGGSITVEAEIVTDNVTLTDAEAWIDVQQLGTNGFPLSTFHSDQRTPLATPTNQTSSSVAWTTTGLTTPVKQTLSVSFTPREVGVIIARVVIAKPSTTVYVDLPRKV